MLGRYGRKEVGREEREVDKKAQFCRLGDLLGYEEDTGGRRMLVSYSQSSVS